MVFSDFEIDIPGRYVAWEFRVTLIETLKPHEIDFIITH